MEGSNSKGDRSALAKQEQITVRRAAKGDVDGLIRITRECYPDRIPWQVGFLARRSWKGILKAPSCETWIWLANGEAAGFCQIVIDVGAWIEERRSWENGPLVFAARLFGLVVHPWLIVRKIQKKIRVAQYKKKRQTPYDEPCTSTIKKRVEHADPNPLNSPLIYYGGIYLDPRDLIWAERVCILPSYRKLWLAVQIERFIDERAMKLGAYAICAQSEAINEEWCRLHERFGYVVTHSKGGRHTYTKILDSKRLEGGNPWILNRLKTNLHFEKQPSGLRKGV